MARGFYRERPTTTRYDSDVFTKGIEQYECISSDNGVSIEAMNWVLNHSRSKGTDRMVMVVLAWHCRQGAWTCYPSVSRIAREAMSSDTAVRRSIKNLVALGELHVTTKGSEDARIRKDRRPNLYVLIPSDLPPVVPRADDPPPAVTRLPADGAYDLPPAEGNREWIDKEKGSSEADHRHSEEQRRVNLSGIAAAKAHIRSGLEMPTEAKSRKQKTGHQSH